MMSPRADEGMRVQISTVHVLALELEVCQLCPQRQQSHSLCIQTSGWWNDGSLPCCSHIIGQALVIEHIPEVSKGAM